MFVDDVTAGGGGWSVVVGGGYRLWLSVGADGAGWWSKTWVDVL